MSASASRSTPKRAYNSSRRAMQAASTRADVLEAAIELFRVNGWSGTTLAAVAERAGVAVETIYNGFGSKKGLLRSAMDTAIVGDPDPVPFVERSEFRSLGEGPIDERVKRAAEVTASIHERSAGVWLAVVEAAAGDEEVDGWRIELERGRRIDVRRSAERVAGRSLDETVVTMMWILYGPETFLKLVGDDDMSRSDYEAFLAEATTLALRATGRPARGRAAARP